MYIYIYIYVRIFDVQHACKYPASSSLRTRTFSGSINSYLSVRNPCGTTVLLAGPSRAIELQ